MKILCSRARHGAPEPEPSSKGVGVGQFSKGLARAGQLRLPTGRRVFRGKAAAKSVERATNESVASAKVRRGADLFRLENELFVHSELGCKGLGREAGSDVAGSLEWMIAGVISRPRR